jgi:hypothetical protein
MIVYLDESGDLGFQGKSGSSKYIIITLLFIETGRMIRYLMKKVRKDLKIPKHIEIKGYNLFPWKLTKTIKLLSDQKFPIYSIIVKKSNVYTTSSAEPDRFYNFLVKEILQQAITELNITSADHLTLVADDKTRKKFWGLDFIPYLEREFNNINLKVRTEDSKAAGIGAVDVISYAIQRLYESNDLSYFRIIKDKVTVRQYLFHK